MRSFQRMDRIASLVRNAMGELFVYEIQDPRVANAVVTHDVPADSIATGIPAVVRRRTDKQREQLVDPTTYVDPAMYI